MTVLPEPLVGQTIVRSAVDERFRVRGPYWRPGDSILAEPWVALGESNTGHLVVPCGRSVEAAHAHVARWEGLHRRGLRYDVSRTIVGGAAVDPRGEVVASWGSVPVPGGAPRWETLHRTVVLVDCAGCGAPRWPGCWLTVDMAGCVCCLPERETADPRPWPVEPEPPREFEVAARVKTPRTRRAAITPDVVSPVDDRLF